MVIVLGGNPVKRSKWGSIGAGLGLGLGQGMEEGLQERKNDRLMQDENEAISKELGIDLSGTRDPQMRRELALEGLRSKKKGRESEEQLLNNRNIIADLEKKRGLEPGELSAYENDVKMAEQVSRPAKEQRPRISEEPITEDQLRRIEEARNDPEYEKASPNEKYRILTGKGVSRANAESEAKIAAEAEKNVIEKSKVKQKKTTERKKQEFEEKIRAHKESDKFDEEVLSKASTAKRTLGNVKEAEKALASKKVTPNSAINILRFFGEPGKALSNAIMNKETKSIQALMPEFLEGKKELFGIRLSDSDLALLQDKSIDIGNSVEANQAVLALIKKYADQSILKGDIASEITKKYENYRPLGFQRMVDEEFDRQTEPVKMIDSKTGKILTVPAYRVGYAIEKGAKIYNEK